MRFILGKKVSGIVVIIGILLCSNRKVKYPGAIVNETYQIEAIKAIIEI